MNSLLQDMPARRSIQEQPVRTLDFRFGEQRMEMLLGYCFTDQIAQRVSEQAAHVLLVADRRVYELWGAPLLAALQRHLPVTCLLVEAIEAAKTLGVLQDLLDQAVAAGATRRSVVVAFGGGLTGNLAGMLAGLLYRGIRLVHIPTTLLAMSDSVLSQKQAVNGSAAKNMYGLYHPASLCCVDVQYLQSLPAPAFSAGVVELCKNGLAFDAATVPALERLAADTTPAGWIELVQLGIQAKQQLLLDDPLEHDLGVVLEYGHTVGHALELETGTLTHGHAVGLGMLVAAAIARERGWLSEQEEHLHAQLLLRCGAPLSLENLPAFDQVMARVRQDNKRGRIRLNAGQYPFVLLRGIGQPAMSQGQPLVGVDEGEIRRAYAKLQAGYYSALRVAE
ncbi:3-dehydroquinate synthase family protein [Pseudomonas entomophila]|uniref:3-dehydroquinate synthase n=2 Tax=Pseudomonas entomophila TaxID=312306 RepID=A0ABY9QLH1_9PSED|nr:3-dehydroquinate synthase [Pseudomonas entomophila]WMW03950.1 hypothetical protein RAH46_16600 [Pseudomonas entomophila]CAK15279.1 putative 3-dehydroquinate synthase [Pseudomonas entomophila L48]